ncbi:hypothetical protein [Saccharothrix sp. HUAS TT1]|uniref:hypothetical protein n=1 Tax=unclassified Saccharothrix TaxID=2593673 RepID=UPI00345BC367
METLEFRTPKRAREEQPIPVTLCGEELVVQRPKDAVLYFAATAIGADVPEPDRAMAVIQFLSGTLGLVDRKRFIDRAIDPADPVDLGATVQLVGGLLERWNAWPARGRVEPLVVEADPAPVTGEPVHIVNEDLELDLVAHPPKDLVLMFVAAALATGANEGQQAWSVGIFLDAALERADRDVVARRMRDHDDDLDLEHIAEIVQHLIERWSPKANRAARRDAARAKGRGSAKAVAGARGGTRAVTAGGRVGAAKKTTTAAARGRGRG